MPTTKETLTKVVKHLKHIYKHIDSIDIDKPCLTDRSIVNSLQLICCVLDKEIEKESK